MLILRKGTYKLRFGTSPGPLEMTSASNSRYSTPASRWIARCRRDSAVQHRRDHPEIRKFQSNHFTADELIRIGSLMLSSSSHCAPRSTDARTFFISGGTGTGKTTLLNALATSSRMPSESY